MNDNINGSSYGENPKSKALLLFASIAVVMSFAAFSANASLYFPLTVCAAATAFVFDILKNPLFGFIAAASAFGVSYLVSKDLSCAVECAAASLLLGALLAVCRRKSLGLFKSSLILGAATFALSAGLTAIYVVRAYGDLIGGAKTAFNDLYESAVTQMKTYLTAGAADVTVAENELREIFSLLATLLPGLAAALLQLTGAATYFISKLYYRIFGQRIQRFEGEYRVPESAVIFFAFSVLIALILSLIKSLRVAYLAALNLCIALAVPALIDGGRRVVSRFRNPTTVVLPDGTVAKRPPVFLICVLTFSLIFSFVAPLAVLAFYSVIGTLKDIIVRSAKKKEE